MDVVSRGFFKTEPSSVSELRTALHGAARRGHSDVAKLLVQADASARPAGAVPLLSLLFAGMRLRR